MLRVITRGDTVQNNRARRIYRCHQISGASLHQSIVILLGTRAEVQLVLHMYVPISTVLLYLTTHLGVRGGILQIIDDCRVLRRGLELKW